MFPRQAEGTRWTAEEDCSVRVHHFPLLEGGIELDGGGTQNLQGADGLQGNGLRVETAAVALRDEAG